MPAAWKGGQLHTQSGDKVWWFDFSNVTALGSYYILDVTNNVKSYNFDIGNDVYNDVMKASVRMFYYQRSGIAKPTTYAGVWADAAAYVATNQDTDCRLVTDKTNAASSKDLSGGWFDAGDFTKIYQFYTFGNDRFTLGL